MDDILAAIYFGQTDFGNRSCTYKGAKKELEAYDKLHETLTKEQLEIFEEFLSLCDDRHAFIQEDAFKRGVKFGFQLCEELRKIELQEV